jgi:UDP-N-acetylglucosamine 2-epimerase (non-hydrolysing)
MKALVVIGTRPEAIKLAPVIGALRKNPRMVVEICATGQHRELLAQALGHFTLTPDYDLAVMTEDQTLASLTAKTIEGMAGIVKASQPQVTIVQGDTTSAMAAALAAFYAHVPVAHVEAGLRTDDKYSPFPEEINRRLVASIAELHFAPTVGAKANLLREGIREDTVFVTGNTAIDALLWTVGQLGDTNIPLERLEGGTLHIQELSRSRVVLVTAHRRENYDKGIKEICAAILEVAQLPEAQIVFPVHFNPNIRKIVMEQLGNRANIHLLSPLDYLSFARVLCASFLVLTDSGGVQEESPSLGKPVLVMRDTTERPEGIAAGNALLVGTNAATIAGTARELWFDDGRRERMARIANPYGDGKAAMRIHDAIEHHFLQ